MVGTVCLYKPSMVLVLQTCCDLNAAWMPVYCTPVAVVSAAWTTHGLSATHSDMAGRQVAQTTTQLPTHCNARQRHQEDIFAATAGCRPQACCNVSACFLSAAVASWGPVSLVLVHSDRGQTRKLLQHPPQHSRMHQARRQQHPIVLLQ